MPKIPVLADTAHETIQRCVMDAIDQRTGGVLYDEGQWWKVGPLGAWVPMPVGEIWAEVQALNGVCTLDGADSKHDGKRISVTAGMCESVAALARMRYTVADAFLRPALGFVTPLGLWQCAHGTWMVRRPVPADRVRLYLDVDPDRTTAPAQWCGALHRAWGHEEDFSARVAWLHEWIGAMLCGEATTYQVAPIFVGDGENGKSVFLDVISGLVPAELRCSVTPEALEDNAFASSMLVGKALNCVAEIPGGELLTSARLKAIIDGSEQSGEQKYQPRFQFRPRAGHVFSANSLPRVRDLSHGFWRRWLLFTCTAARISELERIFHLAEAILAEERARILGYAMEAYGIMLAEARGYSAVPSSVQARDEWRSESDSVQQWVDEACDTDGQGYSAFGSLYDAYKKHALANGNMAVSAKTFGFRLKALGFAPDWKDRARIRWLVVRSLM